MTARPPLAESPILMPTEADVGLPFGVGIAYYRTSHELHFYLRAMKRVNKNRLVVVLALRASERISTADLPAETRIILTGDGASIDPNELVAWIVPDPFRAVAMAMTGLHPSEGLILLFPDDWQGPSPENLIEQARRWRSSPHSPNDDVYFNADATN